MSDSPHILHLVDRDTPSERLRRLRALRERSDVAEHQTVVHVGWGRPALDIGPFERIGGLLNFGPFHGRALEMLLNRRFPTVLHVWAETTLGWLVGGLGAIRADDEFPRHKLPVVIFEADPPVRAASIQWMTGGEVGAAALCTTQRSWTLARAAGASESACVVIRDGVDFAAHSRTLRDADRAALGIGPERRVLLLLPPLVRAAGSFTAAWAALLVDQIRPDVAVLMPGSGSSESREAARVRRVFASCGRGAILCCASDEWALERLLAMSDVALLTPHGEASIAALPHAMASGVPIVATATPAVAELLSHGGNALLSPPDSPKELARRILESLESESVARERAALARSQAYSVFGRQRMFEQYARLYRNIVAGRPAGEDIDDPAFAGAKSFVSAGNRSA